jgi:hypothetical protein
LPPPLSERTTLLTLSAYVDLLLRCSVRQVYRWFAAGTQW